MAWLSNKKNAKTISRAWEDHQMSMVMISDILAYLDHAYMSKNNVGSVKNVGVQLFRNKVVHFGDVRDHLRDTMLVLINPECEGN
ncbi:hypothetical protein MRX96_054375 [Rhipicephalus microplus]